MPKINELKKIPDVIVTVYRGVADVFRVPKNVSIEIVDFDNYEADPVALMPSTYEWTCPICGFVNMEIEKVRKAKCNRCKLVLPLNAVEPEEVKPG